MLPLCSDGQLSFMRTTFTLFSLFQDIKCHPHSFRLRFLSLHRLSGTCNSLEQAFISQAGHITGHSEDSTLPSTRLHGLFCKRDAGSRCGPTTKLWDTVPTGRPYANHVQVVAYLSVIHAKPASIQQCQLNMSQTHISPPVLSLSQALQCAHIICMSAAATLNSLRDQTIPLIPNSGVQSPLSRSKRSILPIIGEYLKHYSSGFSLSFK